MTKKQLAQKRNWFKRQLMGITFHIKKDAHQCLTPEEWCYLENILQYKDLLVKNFDDNNRILGLKPKDKFKWINWKEEECNKIHGTTITNEDIIKVFTELNKLK